MEICSRLTLRLGVALFLTAVTAVLGCSGAGSPRTSPEPDPAPRGEEVRLPPPPQDTVPVPTEADLAVQEARDAEARGEHDRALLIYEEALDGSGEPAVTEIRFQLARLYLDPALEARSIERSHGILQTIVETAPRHARQADARAMLWLIDEVAHAQVLAAELTAENEDLRGQLRVLSADLDEKEQQLERIKQVLLQTKP